MDGFGQFGQLVGRKPGPTARPNFAHPIWRGCRLFLPFVESGPAAAIGIEVAARDAILGTVWEGSRVIGTTGVGWADAPDGPALTLDSGDFVPPAPVVVSGAMTALFAYTPLDVGGYGGANPGLFRSGSDQKGSTMLVHDTTGVVWGRYNSTTISGTGSQLQDGRRYLVGLTFDGVAATITVDGEARASALCSSGTVDIHQIAKSWTGDYIRGHLHWVAVWARSLSVAEQRELHVRPWAPFGQPLFIDPVHSIAVGATASGGGADVSGTGGLVCAAVSVSGVGEPIVVGTSALTSASATTSGVSAVLASAVGDLQAANAITSSAGKVYVGAVGALLAVASAISSVGKVAITGTGNLLSSAASLRGRDAAPSAIRWMHKCAVGVRRGLFKLNMRK